MKTTNIFFWINLNVVQLHLNYHNESENKLLIWQGESLNSQSYFWQKNFRQKNDTTWRNLQVNMGLS